MRSQVWRRLGQVFAPQAAVPWMASHASYPTPLVLGPRLVRSYFSPRDAMNRSSIAAVDLALDDRHFELLGQPRGPLLSPGPRGAFDDSGVTVGCVLAAGDKVHVWYLGWTLGVTVPFRNFIGLAIGPVDGPLERASPAPVLERSAADPLTVGYPWVLRTAEGFQMWYGSHLEWAPTGPAMSHAIKSASSQDGIQWLRDGSPVLTPAGGVEFALSRPCVVQDTGRFQMWYSRRYATYRLGYAESKDGRIWVRRDDSLRFVGEPGAWESESLAYATVFDCGAHRYMLYNGNGYGRTGFGLAVLEDE